MKGGWVKVYGGERNRGGWVKVYGGERNRGETGEWSGQLVGVAQYWPEWLTSSVVLRTTDEGA